MIGRQSNIDGFVSDVDWIQVRRAVGQPDRSARRVHCKCTTAVEKIAMLHQH